MHKKFITCLITCLLAVISVNATNKAPGEITKAMLEEKKHALYPEAPAAFLYKGGSTFVEIHNNLYTLVTEVVCRIKIYSKDGYGFANDQVYFYKGKGEGKVTYTDGYTYNLTSGGQIEKTKLSDEGQFETKAGENIFAKKLVMPNVKEGSIVEYKYRIETPFFQDFKDWYFQYSIPVNEIEYEVMLPLYYGYNTYLTGHADIETIGPNKAIMEGSDVFEMHTIYRAKNVKPFINEGYVNNVENYLAILKHEVASVALPNQEVKYYSTDWKKVAKSIYNDDKFGKELKLNSYFEKDINPLLTPGMDDTQKTTAIFNFVKARMAFDKWYGYRCHKGVANAYAAGSGNVAEINLMLTAMLRYAGLDANPVLVSTRDNGIAAYPSLMAYNYVIAAVQVNGQTMLLDATSKNAQPNIMPVRVLNWEGRLIKKNGDTAAIDLMPKLASKEVVNIFAQIDAKGNVAGKVRGQYYDYNAFVFREEYALGQNEYIEEIEKEHTGIIINEYNVQNDKDFNKPVLEEYSFKHDGLSDGVKGKIYISPMLFFANTQSPFTQEKREYPVDFVFPKQYKYNITINLPEGYKAETIPVPTSINMQDNLGSFKYIVAQNGNSIQLSASLDLNYATVSETYYLTLKDFFQKMVDKQKEQIVLVKSN
jgi:hypothetical protein